MRKRMSYRPALQLALTAALAAAIGCTADSTTPQSDDIVSSISITMSPSTLTVGQTVQAGAVARDATGATLSGVTMQWSSSNPAVITVSQTGLVTAAGVGTASVTAA